MNSHLHPISKRPIEGILLVPGAILRDTDMYDSSDGKWRSCPCPGSTLQAGCETVWVRPGQFDLATNAILRCLSHNGFFLLRVRGEWKIIQDPPLKSDDQLRARITYLEFVQNLIDFGLIVQDRELTDDAYYGITESGRALVGSSRQLTPTR